MNEKKAHKFTFPSWKLDHNRVNFDDQFHWLQQWIVFILARARKQCVSSSFLLLFRTEWFTLSVGSRLFALYLVSLLHFAYNRCAHMRVPFAVIHQSNHRNVFLSPSDCCLHMYLCVKLINLIANFISKYEFISILFKTTISHAFGFTLKQNRVATETESDLHTVYAFSSRTVFLVHCVHGRRIVNEKEKQKQRANKVWQEMMWWCVHKHTAAQLSHYYVALLRLLLPFPHI